jgi:SAM-dependent methyltransferase
MRRSLLLAVVGVCLVTAVTGLRADEGTYRDSLTSRYTFYGVATGRFAPVYPVLADQIVQDYGITTGICVDMGGGCGALAIALAKATNLTVYVLDIDPVAVRLCNLLADEAGLTGRVRGVEGDATSMPFRDGFADLVVSRNSIFAWPDQFAGLREAHRILKPGGVAYIGGGLGARGLDPRVLAGLLSEAREKRAQSTKEWVDLDKDILHRAEVAGMPWIRHMRGPTEFDTWFEVRK